MKCSHMSLSDIMCLHYYLQAIICLSCLHVMIRDLSITDNFISNKESENRACLRIQCFNAGSKSCLEVLFVFLPASTFVLLCFWCSSELKPGVNNRAHLIPPSFSKAPSKACLTSSSCLLFRPIIRQLPFWFAASCDLGQRWHLQICVFNLIWFFFQFGPWFAKKKMNF